MKKIKKCFICDKDVTNELSKIDVNGNHYCNKCYSDKCKTELKEKQMQEIAILINGRTEIDTMSYYVALAKAKEIYDMLVPKDGVVLSDKEKPVDNSNVNHPSHYTDGKVEVIDFIEDKNLNYHRGNAIKYICRAGKKDPSKEIEDLMKAKWYIKREIERLKNDQK